MKQQSDVVRDLTEPGWRKHEEERHAEFKRWCETMHQQTPSERIATLEAALAAAQAENDRLQGKACLMCGAPKPCELADTEYPPCTFDPNPIQAARAFLDRAIKAETERDIVLAEFQRAEEGK
jgi:hypothetical protein